MSLNDLALLSQSTGWTKDDWAHFAQLHGYSVSGWSDLSEVSDKHYARAEAKMSALRQRYPLDPALTKKQQEESEDS